MSQHGLKLLSLDGGGIRGLSELLILREIMWRIQSQQKLDEMPLPCEYFDLIGGTSTGGLIALMLGRLRMSIDEAINCYDTLSLRVFSDTKSFASDGKFKATKLEEIVKEIVMKRTGDANERLLDPQGCKTFVCAMSALNMDAQVPHLFRTYEAPKGQGYNCTIWEAARATSAAPTFFKRIFIGESEGVTKIPFIDGGLGRNNPVAQVCEEAEMMYPGREVACIISIGTGRADTIAIPNPSLIHRMLPVNVIQAMKRMATDCERSAQEFEKRYRGKNHVYFRFNVEQGLQKVGLAQWEKLPEVTAHTKQYMMMVRVDEELDAAVNVVKKGRDLAELTSLR